MEILSKIYDACSLVKIQFKMSRDMWFPTMWYFDMTRLSLLSKQLNSHRIFKRLAKALIRLRVCAGWSKALLVAHTILLDILCRGLDYKFTGEASFTMNIFFSKKKDNL